MREGAIDPWAGQRTALPEDSSPETAQVRQYLAQVRQEARLIALKSSSTTEFGANENGDSPCLDYGSPVDVDCAAVQAVRENGMKKSPIEHEITSNLENPSKKEFMSVEKPPIHSQKLKHETKYLDQIRQLTENLFEQTSHIPEDNLYGIFQHAKMKFVHLDTQHPEGCVSLATWKTYASKNPPIPLSHLNLFRMYKYLSKWGFIVKVYYVWAWALILQTPQLLSGDELALVREMCRALANSIKNQSDSRIQQPELYQLSPYQLGQACILMVIQNWGQHDLEELLLV